MQIFLSNKSDALLRDFAGVVHSKLLRAHSFGVSDAKRRMRAELKRTLSGYYNVLGRDIDRQIVTKPSGSSFSLDHVAEVVLKGKGIPVSLTINWKQTRKGVSYRLHKDGPRLLIKSAFSARMPTGHVGAYRRYGKKRLKIQNLYTEVMSAPFTADSDKAQAVLRAGEDAYWKALDRLLNDEG